MSTIADLLIHIGADVSDAEKGVSGLGAKIRGGLTKAVVPATAALGGLAVGAKKSIDAASDLNEGINAVNVVFGKSGKTITEWGKNAARTTGLSANQINEAVTPMGALFTNMGESQDEAAKKSVALTKRAADMASVFNTSVPDALEAIQAGLRGEADPLERFGVGMSANAVKAKALSMGMKIQNGVLTNSQAAQARYALLMDQTNKVAGDFQRTSGGLANSQRINAAEAANASAAIGKGLLPAYQGVTHVLGSLTSLMAAHAGTVRIVGIAVAALAAGILVLNGVMKAWAAITNVVKAAQIALNIVMDANPIALVVIAIAALVAAFVIAYKKSETFRNFLNGVWSWLKGTFGPVFEEIAGMLKAAWDVVRSVTSSVWGAVKDNLASTWNTIKTIIGDAINAVRGVIKLVMDLIHGDWSGAWNALKAIISSVWDAIKAIVKAQWNAIKGILEGAWTALKKLAQTTWDALKSLIGKAWDAIKDATGKAWDGIKSKIKGAADAIKSLLGAAWDAIKGAVKSAWNTIKSTVGNALGDLKSKITGAIGGLKSAMGRMGDRMIDGLKNALGSLWSHISSKFSALGGAIAGWAGTASAKAFQIGSGIIGGIISGLGGLFSRVKDTITSAVSSAIDAVKGFFGIGSPSKVTRDLIGIPLGQGITEGLTGHLAGLAGMVNPLLARQIGNVSATAPALTGATMPGESAGARGVPLVHVDRMDVRDDLDAELIGSALAARLAVLR